MPNHIHGIIEIDDRIVVATGRDVSLTQSYANQKLKFIDSDLQVLNIINFFKKSIGDNCFIDPSDRDDDANPIYQKKYERKNRN